MPHELTTAFDTAGLPLSQALAEMLDDHYLHRTERRGCGYTQATRFIADFVNLPRDGVRADDLQVFAAAPTAEIERLGAVLQAQGEPRGWRSRFDAEVRPLSGADHAQAEQWLQQLQQLLTAIRHGPLLEESRLFLDLLQQVLDGRGDRGPALPPMPEKPQIGSCSQAEQYFLEIAYERIRRGGSVNTLVQASGEPVLLEKVGLGESHSAIVVTPVHLNGVVLPPGSLCALRYSEDTPAGRRSRHGCVITLESLLEVRFLRLTTLAVSPESRLRAFRFQLEAQVRANMFSPGVANINQLRRFAEKELGGVRP